MKDLFQFMNTRTILIHSYAKKNKSRRKKYFSLSICPDYLSPRLDYFINKEKWNQKKHEIYNNNSDNLSFQSIDLSNLFFVDDVHRSKPKQAALNLYMEDRHLTFILLDEDSKKKWCEVFENIIYKNSKVKSYCKIEHVLEVSIRLKPKENIDKSVYSQLQGNFRACFTKTCLMFVNSSLEKPVITIQYPFIRQWESRYDGTFRLEIGRAALIGECILILQFPDFEDSKAAHAMLKNCIMSFKHSKPDPPKIRNSVDKPTKRNSLTSCSRKTIGSISNGEISSKRYDSCMTFGTESVPDTNSKNDFTVEGDLSSQSNDSNYAPMNGCTSPSSSKSNNFLNYFEHTNRIYKCPSCGYFTKLIIYCSKCCSSVNLNSLSLLCKPDCLDPNSVELRWQLLEPTRTKAQSLTEKPNRASSSCIYKTRQFLSDPNKQSMLATSKSSSKTSTNDASGSSKQESLTSLSVSANRHDDNIFMELDFDNLNKRISNIKLPVTSRPQSQLNCANCSKSLIQKTTGDNLLDKCCSTCFNELVTVSFLINDRSDWRPRTTSLLPSSRPWHGTNRKATLQSEYVDVKPDDIATVEAS